MLPERPSTEKFLRLVDELADIQDDLNKLEYRLKKITAQNVREAMNSGAKTREADLVKDLGNTKEQEREMDILNEQIFEKKKQVRVLWGRIEAWKAEKDLYRTDSYHQVGGRFGSGLGTEE
jgi:hypothetical protein